MEARNGQQVRLANQIDFRSWLSGIASLHGPERSLVTREDELLYADTRMSNDAGPQLILLRVRDGHDLSAEVDTETGEIYELDPGSPRKHAATSIVFFLPFGNLIAHVTSRGGPTVKHVEEILRQRLDLGEMQLVVRPLVSQAQLERLKASDGAARIAMRVGVSSRPLPDRLPITRALNALREAVPDASIIVEFTTRGKGQHETKRVLRDSAIELAQADTGITRMEARVLHYEQDDRESSELVNLLEHAVTVKATFDALGDDGEALDLSQAVKAVERAVVQVESQLRELAPVV